MAHAPAVAQQGAFPGAVPRNLESYGAHVAFAASLPVWQQHLLVDPQTSGGLLVACEPGSVDAVLGIFRRHGFAQAAVVGRVGTAGAGARAGLRPGLCVTA